MKKIMIVLLTNTLIGYWLKNLKKLFIINDKRI